MTWLAMAIPFLPHLTRDLYALLGWHPTLAYVAVETPSGYLRRVPRPAVLDYFKPAYCTIALLALGAMLTVELRRGFCLPRLVLIITQGLGLVLVWFAGLWGLAIIAINHWLTSIGLASHIADSQRCNRTAAVIMLAGTLLFCALFVDPHMVWAHGLSAATLHFSFAAVAFRLGLGFVHFLYDRWLYKFSDPAVRATIGAAVFDFKPQPHISRIKRFALQTYRASDV